MSSVEPTLDDDDDDDLASPGARRRGKLRLALFIAACFLGGAGIAAAGAHQLGYLGGAPQESRQGYRERAERALRSRHWNSPPNENVKDITDQGLAHHPGDPDLLDVRQRAAEELVTTALGRKYAGDIDGALQLASLARELSPNNTTAQHLAAELERLAVDAGLTVLPVQEEAGSPSPIPSRTAPHRVPSGTATPPSSTPSPVPTPSSTAPHPVPPEPTASPPTPSATGGRWL